MYLHPHEIHMDSKACHQTKDIKPYRDIESRLLYTMLARTPTTQLNYHKNIKYHFWWYAYILPSTWNLFGFKVMKSHKEPKSIQTHWTQPVICNVRYNTYSTQPSQEFQIQLMLVCLCDSIHMKSISIRRHAIRLRTKTHIETLQPACYIQC